MKKIVMVAVAVVVLVAGFSVSKARAESASMKIGSVNINRAINESNEGKAANAKMDAEVKAKKQKIDAMQNELKKMGEDLEKQRLILSADALKEKQQAAQQKYMEFQKTGMEFEKQLAQAQDAALKPITERLQKVIQQIGKDDGYSLIVPSEAALYTPGGSDITDKVIAAFNSGKGK